MPWAPEVRGGGGDAMIEAFHEGGGRIRRRVIVAKPLASLLTLGSGGAGGREGPTMQLGGAVGAFVASLMPAGERARRVLMIAASDDASWAVAADLMVAPQAVNEDTPLAEVARLMLDCDLRAVPVLDATGRLLGLIDEHDVSRAYLGVSDGDAHERAGDRHRVAKSP